MEYKDLLVVQITSSTQTSIERGAFAGRRCPKFCDTITEEEVLCAERGQFNA